MKSNKFFRKKNQVAFLTALVIYFFIYQQFLFLDNSTSKKICNEVAGSYDNIGGGKAVINDIGSDNVITGIFRSDLEFHCVVNSNCTGSNLFIAINFKADFRFEDCKLLWSNEAIWVKEGYQIPTM